MKTNQIMTRKMGDFNVYQRTIDAYFDASSLMQQWNDNTNGRKKQMSEYINSKASKEFLNALAKKQQKEKFVNGDNQEVTLLYVLKGKSTRNGKTPDKVWMHPYVFLDFAMWLNPRFRVEVIQFVYDQLISLRNTIGDDYKDYSVACAKIGCKTPDDYKNMARCLNCAVLGVERQSKQRNELNEEEITKINKLQETFITAVANDWITDIDSAKKFFRNEYNKNYKSIPF